MCRAQRPRRSEHISRLQSPTRYLSDVGLKGALCASALAQRVMGSQCSSLSDTLAGGRRGDHDNGFIVNAKPSEGLPRGSRDHALDIGPDMGQEATCGH